MISGEHLRDYASDEAGLRLRISGAPRPIIQPKRQELKHASDRPPKTNNQLAVTKNTERKKRELMTRRAVTNLPIRLISSAQRDALAKPALYGTHKQEFLDNATSLIR